MSIPKVFISYSHDNQEHKKWILNLAIRLRNFGIDAILDQWDLKPGDDLPHYMETNLAISDFVLMVCTKNYVTKANEGKGGVGYEKMIITSNLLSRIDESKILPLIRQTDSKDVPTFLKTKLYIDFSNPNDFEFSFDELVRTIHKSPLFKKPPVGNNPFKENKDTEELKVKTGLHELMTIIVMGFESSNEDYIYYNELRNRMDVSRVYLDTIIAKAVSNNYIRQDSDKDVWLLDAGKKYALNTNIIK